MQIDFESLLNLPDVRVTEVQLTDREAHIYCESVQETGYCPQCWQPTRTVCMYHTRRVRDLSLVGRTVYLHLQSRQFHCSHCDRYFNEKFAFVEPSKTLTTRYEQYIYRLCEDICIIQVCVKEDLTWARVNDIYRRNSEQEVAARAVWRRVRYLGIDEIAVRKGHKNYACSLVDLERGIVLDFLESRHKADIVKYFQAKGEALCRQIEVVSSDMWEGYSTLAGELFPHAISVIDRYHFFVHINQALDRTRKQLRQEFPDEKGWKHLRWALLKQPAKLSVEEAARVKQALELSPELRQVHRLRQELKELFDEELSQEEASAQLARWEAEAVQSGSKELAKFLKTLRKWRDKVLNYFPERLTNGVVEGLNNAIRGIIRRSFGFGNFANLKRRVLVELG